MNDLARSIIATLAYYDGFGWPLTPIEVYERLIPASRLGGRSLRPTLGDIVERLPEQDFSGRIEQEKIWAQKWRHLRRKAWWLQMVPYVRGLYASGSLVLGNTSEQSDWDVFVVAQSGHLYGARMGLLAVAWLMRALRTKHDAVAADKFCFNHYVTTDGLSMQHRSLFTAHGLALLTPIFDPRGYLPKLWHANRWIEQYRPMPSSAESVRRSVGYSPIFQAIRRLGELLLGWAEPFLRRWQQRRIADDPATHQSGGRVIATDREIEFHPRSFERIALGRYNTALDSLGLGAFHEQDSGLTK